MRQADDTMEFGGHHVEFRKVPGDVLVSCKNVIGTYTQAKAFVRKSSPTNIYQWGVKTTEPAYIENVPGGDVKIACLQDTHKKFMELYNKCEALQSSN